MTKVWTGILIVAAAVGSFLLAAPVIESATRARPSISRRSAPRTAGLTRNMFRLKGARCPPSFSCWER